MKDEILNLIKELGPIVPSEITSKLGEDSMIVSALISELIRNGKVKYSHKKIGSSPLYYVEGQEDEVRKRLLDELKIPEKKIIEYFEKNKLVLRNNLTPQQRYMIDELKDYITSIKLEINGDEKLFYKHHSISKQNILDDMNKFKNKSKEKEEELDNDKIFESKKEEKEEEEDEKEKKEESDVVETEKSAEVKSFKQIKLGALKNKSLKIKDEDEYKKFDDLSERFFKKYNLTVIKSNKIRKGSEANFIIVTNDNIRQKYFVKYYSKKRINEKDISKAHTSAQIKKLPCIILTTGKLTNKAKDLLPRLGSLLKIVKVKE